MRIVRDFLVLGIAAFFAVMWGAMLRERLVLAPSQPVRPNYEKLLDRGEKTRTAVLGIYRGDTRLGRTRTTITREQGAIQLHSNTRFELGDLIQYMAPNVQDLEVSFSATITPVVGLRFMQVECPQLDVSLRGFVQEDELRVRGSVGGEQVNRRIPYAKQPFLGDAFSPMSGLPELDDASPGDVWTMHVVNPIIGGVQQVRVRLARSRTVRVGGETLRVHELEFEGGGRSWGSCVTGDGRVLVQGTPFGLTLRRENVSSELRDYMRRQCRAMHGNDGR
jgi:hypothetical protein